ncbi:MAG: response regulator, partial [Rhizomicrobium sp.]
DSSAIRRIVSALFRDLNFDVVEAPTGRHAVEHCRREVPDVILLDWNMPEMDGISCLRTLRAMEMSRRPVIVMCTSEIKVSKILEALAAGADEYIMKPFNRDVLLDKLSQLSLS